MSDKELLELAAKATGKTAWWSPSLEDWQKDLTPPYVDGVSWNPLTDDGDALRLAARLNFRVDISYGTVRIVDELDNEHYLSGIVTDCGGQMVIVRLAIVRAAASVGETLP